MFHVYLPKDTESVEVKEPAVSVHPDQGSGVILLVDDTAAVLAIAKKMLEILGYTILSSDSPKEALRIAESCPHTIDLLITDMAMPELSGRELADAVQDLFPDIKVLFMSGYIGSSMDMQDDSASFIQKPFSLKDLSGKIRNLLGS